VLRRDGYFEPTLCRIYALPQKSDFGVNCLLPTFPYLHLIVWRHRAEKESRFGGKLTPVLHTV